MPALTGLRFFLAALVMLFHVAGDPMKDAPAWLARIIGHGYLAVNAFFMLSGFVLAHTYLDAAGKLKGTRRNFWVARFARIYPVYALTIIFSFPHRAEIPGNPPQGWEDALASFSVFGLAQAWIPKYALWIDSAAWSLSAEAFFYVLFPLAAKFRWNRGRAGLVGIIAACWILCLAAPATASLAFAYGGTRLTDLMSRKWVSAFFEYNPLFHVPAFMMGIAAQRLFLLESSGKEVAFRRPAAMSILAIGVIVAVLGFGPPIPRLFVHNGLLSPAFACLTLALATGRGAIAHLLSRPFLVLLGEASYSLYLLHLPLWGLTRSLNAGTLNLPDSSWGFLLADVALTIGVSLLALRFVEKPYRASIAKSLWRPAVA